MPRLPKISGKDAKEPRIMAGEISEMYTGATMTAKPMPMPASNRPAMSMAKEGENIMMAAPAWNTAAARPMVHFRPMASEVRPAARQPRREMKVRHPTSSSCCTSVMWMEVLLDEDDAATHHTDIWILDTHHQTLCKSWHL